MTKEEMVLDALAWAGLTEQARVARIASLLARELPEYNESHTKTHIKDVIRKTSPPYGRAKYIFEAVCKEYPRQVPIYRERQKNHKEWREYQEHQKKRSTRLNNAYAHAFDRPPYTPFRQFPGGWNDNWDERRAWDNAESARDKGDECIGLTHHGDTLVCLVKSVNGSDSYHVATKTKSGEINRIYLRGSECYRAGPANLVEAAISLGGPKVRSALAKGKKVETNWTNRSTLIYHEGQDHVHPNVEIRAWRTENDAGERTMTLGEDTKPDRSVPIDGSWNDYD